MTPEPLHSYHQIWMKNLKVTICLSGNRELSHRGHILLLILLCLPNLNNWELLFIYIVIVECFGLLLTISSVNKNH